MVFHSTLGGFHVKYGRVFMFDCLRDFYFTNVQIIQFRQNVNILELLMSQQYVVFLYFSVKIVCR